MTHVHKTRQSEAGFTLVELAIVMVIIGLLIGGILKGQELIANAQVTATVGQVKGLDAALNTFQDKYNALPGDMQSPSTRLPSCTTNPCADAGDGDGFYDNGIGADPAATSEGVVAFPQLAAADLISGVNPASDSVTFGNALPSVKSGGGMWIASSTSTGGGASGMNLAGNKAYVVLNGTTSSPGTDTGAFSPETAAQIDRKLDDGLPRAGSTQSVCSDGIGGGTPPAYEEAVTEGTCAMVSRVLN